MKTRYLLPVLAVLALACGETKKPEAYTSDSTATAEMPASESRAMANYQWLAGSWTMDLGPYGIMTENWNPQDDSTMTGDGVIDSSGKKTPFENFTMQRRGGVTSLVIAVMGQNDNKPVEFKVTSEDANGFVSENPGHDYPNKIAYKKESDTSMVATVEGMQGGKPKKEEFRMVRK